MAFILIIAPPARGFGWIEERSTRFSSLQVHLRPTWSRLHMIASFVRYLQSFEKKVELARAGLLNSDIAVISGRNCTCIAAKP